MPNGIYKKEPMTPEHRNNLSISHIGQKAWNKGISNEITRANANKAHEALRGKPAWNKGLKMPQITGERHPAFKGNQVSYGALHDWVYYTKGKPIKCAHCGINNNLQWANKSHEYKRELDDWLELCSSCHSKYDGIAIKIWQIRKSK